MNPWAETLMEYCGLNGPICPSHHAKANHRTKQGALSSFVELSLGYKELREQTGF